MVQQHADLTSDDGLFWLGIEEQVEGGEWSVTGQSCRQTAEQASGSLSAPDVPEGLHHTVVLEVTAL